MHTLNQYKDLLFVAYVVFFGAYVLNDVITFLCSVPLFLLAYAGLWGTEKKTLYVLRVDTDNEIIESLELLEEINEFDTLKVVEIHEKKNYRQYHND